MWLEYDSLISKNQMNLKNSTAVEIRIEIHTVNALSPTLSGGITRQYFASSGHRSHISSLQWTEAGALAVVDQRGPCQF
jgi:hypothetical protein